MLNLKQHYAILKQLIFFAVVYMSPFVGVYVWVFVGIGKGYSFSTLLLGGFMIWGIYFVSVLAYRVAQPYLQYFRTTRAARKEINMNVP